MARSPFGLDSSEPSGVPYEPEVDKFRTRAAAGVRAKLWSPMDVLTLFGESSAVEMGAWAALHHVTASPGPGVWVRLRRGGTAGRAQNHRWRCGDGTIRGGRRRRVRGAVRRAGRSALRLPPAACAGPTRLR